MSNSGGRSGEGEGGGGGAQGDGAGADMNFPPRFVSDSAKSTFKYLKKVEVSTPFAFQLIPPEDKEEKSELFKKIRLAGGTIHPGVDVEAYVPGHENEDIRVPLDTYSSAFVYRCILNKNRGLPLPHPWKYLIPSGASIFGFYDARKILREEMEWEDVGKLVFPPKDKRITAQQWLAELRRQQAKLQMTTAPPPPSDDSLPSQNLNLSNGGDLNDSVGSSHNQRNSHRKRSREPEKDDNTKETEKTDNYRQQTIPLKNKDAAQPISSPASTFVAITTSSNGIQVSPPATPSSSKALSPSQVKIQVQAVKLGSSTSPPKNPSELRIEFERAAPPKPKNQSSSTTTGSTSRIVPPSPKKSKTDSTSRSNAMALTKGGNDTKSLRNKEKPPETETTSLSPSSKPHSSSAKLNGSVSASAPSSSASSSTSGNGRESSSPPKARLGKVVAVAGPKSRRYGPKPVPPPARDDGWVNCDDKNESSDDESVHFSDKSSSSLKTRLGKVVAVSGPKRRRNRNRRDSKVNVKPKPKLKPYLERLYSVEEGQRLLDLICHHNAYIYVHGLKFWKLVEGSKKFQDRTYQSLKDHFHKIVVRALTSKKTRDASIFKIDPENLKKLKVGLQNKINKHHNMCPDFEI
ncbi:unnamed protein product [Orchesella dallaii]|uniref:Telomeric repeat-binding factor 2-interacting protein 1 n=1 Tax=Orchesella dallaii TaxID=48710 RepID=A0ABP1RQD4_9HEXA